MGPYEVGALIGKGGMGNVYRATDTNLRRAVAIKVLPEDVATDGQRLARFQREAEVLARLSHPNIAQIYGLEKSDSATALVMELVEGRSSPTGSRRDRFPLMKRCPSRLRLPKPWKRHMSGASSTVISNRQISSCVLMER